MREILFRGKRCDNGEWVEGFYVRADHHWHNNGIHKDWIICGASANGGWFALHNKYAVKKESLGQFTGLTDKNGKKIFEGDCWLDTDGDYLVYVVEFRDGQFGFVCYGVQGMLMPYGFDEDAGGFGEIEFLPFTDFNMDLIEITGNIHDNPELIGGKGNA